MIFTWVRSHRDYNFITLHIMYTRSCNVKEYGRIMFDCARLTDRLSKRQPRPQDVCLTGESKHTQSFNLTFRWWGSTRKLVRRLGLKGNYRKVEKRKILLLEISQFEPCFLVNNLYNINSEIIMIPRVRPRSNSAIHLFVKTFSKNSLLLLLSI